MPTSTTLQEIQSKIAGLQPDATDSRFTADAKKRERASLAKELYAPIERLQKGQTNYSIGNFAFDEKKYAEDYPSILADAQTASKMLLDLGKESPEIFDTLPDFLKEGTTSGGYYQNVEDLKSWTEHGKNPGQVPMYSGQSLLQAISEGKDIPGFSQRADQSGNSGFSFSGGGAMTQFEKAQARVLGKQTYDFNGQQYAFDPTKAPEMSAAWQEEAKRINSVLASRGKEQNFGVNPMAGGKGATEVQRMGMLQGALDPNQVSVGMAKKMNTMSQQLGGGMMQEGSTGQYQDGTRQDVLGSYRGVTTPPQDISLHRGSQEYGTVGVGQPIPSVQSNLGVQTPTQIGQNGTEIGQGGVQDQTGSPTAPPLSTTQPAPNPAIVARSAARVARNAQLDANLGETKGDLDSLKVKLKADPALNSAFTQIIGMYDNRVTELAGMIATMKTEMDDIYQTDEELQAQVDKETELAIQQQAREDAFAKEVFDLKQELAETTKKSVELAYQKAKVISDGQIRSAQTKLIDDEVEYRRTLGARGLESDSYQLERFQRFMSDAEANINDMITVSNLTQLEGNLQTVNGFNNSIKQSILELESARGAITAATNEKIKLAKTTMNQSKTERKKAIMDAQKWGFEQYDKATKDKLDKMYEIQKDANSQRRETAKMIEEKETAALDKIEYLLANFPREEVKDEIKRLAGDVSSFDASIFANSDTIDVRDKLAKARASVSGGAYYGSSLPQQAERPVMSFDEFVEKQIGLLEDENNISFSGERRDKAKEENMEAWEMLYKSTVSPSIDMMPSSGDVRIDTLAQGLIDGSVTRSSLRLAAKEEGVSMVDVLNQEQSLREAGYVADAPVLTTDQRKAYSSFMREVKQTEAYQTAIDAYRIIRGIKSAIANNNGLGDVTAINLLQRGMIDKGMAVRQDDINNITKSVPVLAQYSPQFWMDKWKTGDRLPAIARQQFITLAENLGQDYVDSFNETELPRIRRDALRMGLPESLFNSIDDIDTMVGEQSLDDLLSEAGLSPTEQ